MQEDKRQWLSVSKAEIEPNKPYKIRLKKVPFDLILIKKVYHNLNGTVGVQYLVSSDTELEVDTLNPIYKDRWSSEDVHRCRNVITSSLAYGLAKVVLSRPFLPATMISCDYIYSTFFSFRKILFTNTFIRIKIAVNIPTRPIISPHRV